MTGFNVDVGPFQQTFISLLQGGVPIQTIIDIGSADGSFGLSCLVLKRDLHVLNVDANGIFESSLKEIEDGLGIPYRIIALSAHQGRITMGDGLADSPYHFMAGGEHSEKYIDCITLDSLLSEFCLPEPYFIKMDVEGMEFDVLQGAENTLSKTAAILMEQHISGGSEVGDFSDKCNYLARRSFSLFDIRDIYYKKRNLNLNAIDIQSGSDSNPAILATFHPVFINDRFDFRHMRDQVTSSEQEETDTTLLKNLTDRRLKYIESNRQLIAYLQRDNTV
jgi:FkbM family methyltransferase